MRKSQKVALNNFFSVFHCLCPRNWAKTLSPGVLFSKKLHKEIILLVELLSSNQEFPCDSLFEFEKIKMIFDIAQTRAKIIWLHKTFFNMGKKAAKTYLKKNCIRLKKQEKTESV